MKYSGSFVQLNPTYLKLIVPQESADYDKDLM